LLFNPATLEETPECYTNWFYASVKDDELASGVEKSGAQHKDAAVSREIIFELIQDHYTATA
jgi:hypothetical protein